MRRSGSSVVPHRWAEVALIGATLGAWLTGAWELRVMLFRPAVLVVPVLIVIAAVRAGKKASFWALLVLPGSLLGWVVSNDSVNFHALLAAAGATLLGGLGVLEVRADGRGIRRADWLKTVAAGAAAGVASHAVATLAFSSFTLTALRGAGALAGAFTALAVTAAALPMHRSAGTRTLERRALESARRSIGRIRGLYRSALAEYRACLRSAAAPEIRRRLHGAFEQLLELCDGWAAIEGEVQALAAHPGREPDALTEGEAARRFFEAQARSADGEGADDGAEDPGDGSLQLHEASPVLEAEERRRLLQSLEPVRRRMLARIRCGIAELRRSRLVHLRQEADRVAELGPRASGAITAYVSAATELGSNRRFVP